MTRCIATGVAGLSIEDFAATIGRRRSTISTLALARVKAARAAIDKAGGDVVFTARTEGFIRGRPDIDETIRRLKAFADAGADCLYSPGIKTREHIEATVKAVGGKAINFLNSGALGFTVSDLAGMGVRRISVGGSLARVAMHAFIKTATADRQGRQVRRLRRPDHQRRAEQVLRRRPQELAMTVESSRSTTGQPVGLAVDPTPGAAPRAGDARKAATAGSSGSAPRARRGTVEGGARPRRHLDLYVGHGPFADDARVRRLDRRPRAEQGPYFYAVVDAAGRAVGISR